MLQFMNDDQRAAMLLFANSTAELVRKTISIESVLAQLLIAAQIAVAVGTALWFFRKARGAKLDNASKEKSLNENKNTDSSGD